MKLSIITVNFNNRIGLKKTIKSILAQTNQDFEWIIIDGGSTDGSKELIERNAARVDYWVSEPDKGIYNAMNKAIKVANGDYCLFMNSGDFLDADDIIETVVPYLDGVDYLFGDDRVVDGNGNELRTSLNPLNPPIGFWLYLNVCHQSMFIRTTLLKDRPYREELRVCADWEHVFHNVVINGCTTKSIRLIIPSLTAGGYAAVHGEKHMQEKFSVIDAAFSHDESANMIIDYCKSQPNPGFEISRFAYSSFANKRFSNTEFRKIFCPYRKDLITSGPVYMRWANRLCMMGLPGIAHTLMSMVRRLK